MAQMIYTLVFIVSMILLLILVANYGKRISIFYVLLFGAVMITNFAYMQLASAQNVPQAIYANQVCYLGGCFTPFFLTMCMADLCKSNIKRIYQALLVAYSCILFTFSSTIGITTWYYKSYYLIFENGGSNLIKEYGPLHSLYPLNVIINCIICFSMIWNAFRRKKDVSYITSILLFVCMVFTSSIYVIEKSFHLTIELLPFAYVIAESGILYLLRRISLYDITAISADSMVESLSYGFVLVDSNGKFLGGDEAAKHWFPEIKELAIDVKMNTDHTPFLQQIGKWLQVEDKQEILYIPQGDLIIEAKHLILKQKKSNAIHCIYLRDDTKQQKYNQLVNEYNANLERDVNAKTKKLRKIQNDIIVSMASIVENRDNNTGGHIARTSDIVNIFVKYLLEKGEIPELTEEVGACITKAAPLHDFGKIAIPDIILNKPGRFTDEEYEIMKQHSAKGAVIVKQILRNSDDETFKKIAVNVAHFHHEKWDGTGYPTGLQGTKIPFEARVMALADVFDALVSKRVYKDSMDYDTAFRIIEESCGTHFDPVLCKAFLACRAQLEALYNSYND